MRGRKSPRRIQAAGGHVDEVIGVEVLVSQRRAAVSAEVAFDLGRRFILTRSAARETEFRFRERDPRDHRRSGRAATRLAVADHAVGGIRGSGISHGTAHAAALDVLIQDPLPFLVAGAQLTACSATKKRAPPERGSSSAETGVLFRCFWSVETSRVPVSTITLCHERAFSPTLKTPLLRGTRTCTGLRLEVARRQSIPEALDLRPAPLARDHDGLGVLLGNSSQPAQDDQRPGDPPEFQRPA